MKKSFKNSCKGFTLIEVLVAMAILGLASMLLVGMYASVCARVRSNNDFNDRMSEQQKYVEESSSNTSLFDVVGSGSDNSYNFTIQCVTNNADTSWEDSGWNWDDKKLSGNGKKFTAYCEIWTLKNLETSGSTVRAKSDADDDDDVQVDFKYFVAK